MRINPARSWPSIGCCNFVLDRKRQIVRSRAEMPCLDLILTGVHVSLKNNEYSQTSAVPAILSIIHSLNKYFKFLSDKLPFTSTLTGMSEFNHFSTSVS